MGFDRPSSRREKHLSPVNDRHTSLDAERSTQGRVHGERVFSDGTTKIYDPKNDDAWIISDTAVPLEDGTGDRKRSGDSR